MNILAIESASIVCGVALFLNNKLVELNEVIQSRIHGGRLPVVIDQLLTNHKVDPNQLDGFAISSGPGTYTGLRIGINLIRGLAAASKVPIIQVPTLRAMNAHIKQEGIYWVILHSHKNMVYAQRYNSGRPDSEIIYEKFQMKKYINIYGFNLEKICEYYESAPPSAQYIGELALKNYDKWLETDLNQIAPNYIANFNLNKMTKA